MARRTERRGDRPLTTKEIVEDVLGPQRVRTLWTANYYPALSVAPQTVDIGAVLPAMLYMGRFGHRRGRGRFVESAHRKSMGSAPSWLPRQK